MGPGETVADGRLSVATASACAHDGTSTTGATDTPERTGDGALAGTCVEVLPIRQHGGPSAEWPSGAAWPMVNGQHAWSSDWLEAPPIAWVIAGATPAARTATRAHDATNLRNGLQTIQCCLCTEYATRQPATSGAAPCVRHRRHCEEHRNGGNNHATKPALWH